MCAGGSSAGTQAYLIDIIVKETGSDELLALCGAQRLRLRSGAHAIDGR
eukprot:SAG11_NODE_184_length_13162_cov_9.151803_10_plen_49_part_00